MNSRFAFAAFALVSAGVAMGQQYHVVDLGNFNGTGNSTAFASNANGQATGDADVDALNRQAFYYSPGTGMVDIGNFATNPGGQSQGEWINAGGEIVGWGTASSGLEHAFHWTLGGGMTDMGLLAGGTGSVATAINDGGEAVGYADTTGSPYEPFTWTQGGGMVNIGGFHGLTDPGTAHGLNRNGQVAGSSVVIASQYSHAFRYTPGQGFLEIGDFDGGNQDSVAYGINDAGNVVGYGTIGTAGGGRSTAAFFWSSGTGQINLGGADPNHPNDTATGINNSNQVVGWGFVSGVGDKGWIWTQAHGLQEMDTLLDAGSAANWDVISCSSINDQGVIAAQAFHPGANGTSRFAAVLLVPVPEPGALLTFGAGIALFLRHRRRRV